MLIDDGHQGAHRARSARHSHPARPPQLAERLRRLRRRPRASACRRPRSRDGLASFPGLAHRQELVATIDGVRYVNDSKATNADAAAKALVCYDDIYWIAGGQAKEGGIASLGPSVRPRAPAPS